MGGDGRGIKMGEGETWWTGARHGLAFGFDSGTGSLCCWGIPAYGQGGRGICVFVKLFCPFFRGQLAPARRVRLDCLPHMLSSATHERNSAVPRQCHFIISFDTLTFTSLQNDVQSLVVPSLD
jgi:hypothetical protein